MKSENGAIKSSRGEGAMNVYRAYLLDENDHIVKRIDLDAPDDQVAIAKAKAFIDGKDIEVWYGSNKIVRISSK